jgi:hypothetical protein
MSNATPTPKVAAGSAAGALTVLLVWVLGSFGVDVPAEAAAALATLLGFATAYMVPDGTGKRVRRD